MITILDFRTRFTEFSDTLIYSDNLVQLMIDDSLLWMGADETRWCKFYDLAQAYLVAHLLTNRVAEDLGGGNASTKVGQVLSKSAGGVSVTRGAVNSDSINDGWLLGNPYGTYFLQLRNMVFPAAAIV